MSAVLWQDVECGGYDADLARLSELARTAPGRVAELGAGSGRVALELARGGSRVVAIERDAGLAGALASRGKEQGLGQYLEVIRSEASEAPLDPGSIALVLAPMQFLHLVEPAARAVLWRRAHDWLVPGGRFAAVVLADPAESITGGPDDAPPLPDVREVDGWVLSSLPLAVRAEPGRLEVERLRQSVSPAGELAESRAVDVLWELAADDLVLEATEAGFAELSRERLPGDEAHVDSTLILLESR